MNTHHHHQPQMPRAAPARYCVLIPVFQAGKTIGELVRRITQLGFPVVVVDDGSQDDTAAMASQAGAFVISHVRNRGKGTALRTGFQYALRARYDGIITMDGDGQHDPNEIAALIRAGEAEQAGMVLGNRMSNGGPMPRARRWTNEFMSDLISAVARQRIPDSQCGFRLIRREVLEGLPLRGKRFEIETELVLAAAVQRCKIISVPVQSIYDNHQSHIRPIRESLRFLRVILRYLARR